MRCSLMIGPQDARLVRTHSRVFARQVEADGTWGEKGIARDTPPLFIVLMLSGCRGWLLSSCAEAFMLGRTDAFEVLKEATSMPTHGTGSVPLRTVA